MTLVGSGVTAIATAGISSNSIKEIFLNNDGSGYSSAPTVTFSGPNSGINTATAVAVTTSKANVQSILRLELTNGGSGYTTTPTITITGGGGTGAAATCSIGGTQFSVSSISISNPGNQYSVAPIITIGSPGVGVTATAIAGITTDNKLDYIRILNPGIGYTQAPTVSIAGLSTIGVGTYIFNEVITGESSGTTAVVKDFTNTNLLTSLSLSLNTGKFNEGEVVVGSSSSARYTVLSYDTESYDNPYDTNEEIELEADNILDFTESNPFGSY